MAFIVCTAKSYKVDHQTASRFWEDFRKVFPERENCGAFVPTAAERAWADEWMKPLLKEKANA